MRGLGPSTSPYRQPGASFLLDEFLVMIFRKRYARAFAVSIRYAARSGLHRGPALIQSKEVTRASPLVTPDRRPLTPAHDASSAHPLQPRFGRGNRRLPRRK